MQTPSLFTSDPPACTPPARPPVSSPEAAPGVLEYVPVGESAPWRVEKPDELRLRFHIGGEVLTVEHLRSLHEALRGSALWLLVRRLFGLAPVIPPADADPADLRAWSAVELGEVMGLTPALIEAQLGAARVLFQQFNHRAHYDEPPAPAPATPAGELVFSDDDILERHGFPPSMFELKWTEGSGDTRTTRTRPASENGAERAWFAGRVREMEKMLTEPRGGASGLARRVLINEMDLRRLELEMVSLRPSSREWENLHERKADLEERISEQHNELARKFPDLNVAGKVTFRQSLGDLTAAMQQYYGYGDYRLHNKICTVAEMEWLTRQSVQLPTPRLRMGQQLAILSAIEGLWDPNWRPSLAPTMLRRLDAAGQAAIEAVRSESGEPLVDLEKEDAQFPDFIAAPEPGVVK